MKNELFQAARAVRGVQDKVAELEKLCRGAAESIETAAAARDPNALASASLRADVALKQCGRVLGEIDALEKQVPEKEEKGSGLAAFPDRDYTAAVLGQMKASVSAWQNELAALGEAAALAGRAAAGARQIDATDAMEKAHAFSEALMSWQKNAEEH